MSDRTEREQIVYTWNLLGDAMELLTQEMLGADSHNEEFEILQSMAKAIDALKDSQNEIFKRIVKSLTWMVKTFDEESKNQRNEPDEAVPLRSKEVQEAADLLEQLKCNDCG